MLYPVETVISLKAGKPNVAGNWTHSYVCLGTIEMFQCY